MYVRWWIDHLAVKHLWNIWLYQSNALGIKVALLFFFNDEFLCTYPNQNREVILYEVSLSAIWRLYFHPAKFDNFKDEKMSDYKTVSVTQSKNLLDWKPASLTNYELPMRAFFLCFLGQKIKKENLNIVASELKSCIKWSKKNHNFFSKFNYEF